MSGNVRTKSQSQLAVEGLEIFDSYMKSPYLSIKHTSYFHAYERLLSPFRGKAITLVEIGVLNGGSLFMWRDYLGPTARIIGVEFNPDAERWREHGFEIFIGDQSDPDFWASILPTIGGIDVCIDDGGHSNLQQIVTTALVTPHIKDGGLMIVEDTHTSFMRQFGNPSKYSFVNFAKDVTDAIHSRFPSIHASHNALAAHVSSVSFMESMVVFHVNRDDCFISEPTANSGITFEARDYRYHGTLQRLFGDLREHLFRRFNRIDERNPLRRLATGAFSTMLFIQQRLTLKKEKKYFG
jgi:hypothetical protein